jgi:hypothetical protein
MDLPAAFAFLVKAPGLLIALEIQFFFAMFYLPCFVSL